MAKTLKEMGIKRTSLRKHGGLIAVYEYNEKFYSEKEHAINKYKEEHEEPKTIKYYCKKCKRYHKYHSKIGQHHLKNKINHWVKQLENIMDYNDPKIKELKRKIKKAEKYLK